MQLRKDNNRSIKIIMAKKTIKGKIIGFDEYEKGQSIEILLEDKIEQKELDRLVEKEEEVEIVF